MKPLLVQIKEINYNSYLNDLHPSLAGTQACEINLNLVEEMNEETIKTIQDYMTPSSDFALSAYKPTYLVSSDDYNFFATYYKEFKEFMKEKYPEKVLSNVEAFTKG